ncbi:TetR/AcrR family transcriptional regulator [Pseudomonas sp. LRF_L74]|uniref:TetR/AcrR family transcriptional regulator n=1 Tax=Pseudomonas sp. LRF_L74 TaxID=3369422 RepID=UPI003F5E628C
MPAAPAHQARDRVINAAIQLFASHGYHAIGLRDLAGHLGLHAGSLYHHIENKQSLLFELVESTLADLLFNTQQQVKNCKSGSERLRRFVDTFVSFSHSDRDRLTLLTRDAVYLTAEQGAQIEQLRSSYSKLLDSIIAGEMKSQGNAHDIRSGLVANAVIGMLFGHHQWHSPDKSGPGLCKYLTILALGMIDSGKRYESPSLKSALRSCSRSFQ